MFNYFLLFIIINQISCLDIKVAFLSVSDTKYKTIFDTIIDKLTEDYDINIEKEIVDFSDLNDYKTKLNELKNKNINIAFGHFDMGNNINEYDKIAKDNNIYIFNSYLTYDINICLTNIIINTNPCDSDNAASKHFTQEFVNHFAIIDKNSVIYKCLDSASKCFYGKGYNYESYVIPATSSLSKEDILKKVVETFPDGCTVYMYVKGADVVSYVLEYANLGLTTDKYPFVSFHDLDYTTVRDADPTTLDNTGHYLMTELHALTSDEGIIELLGNDAKEYDTLNLYGMIYIFIKDAYQLQSNHISSIINNLYYKEFNVNGTIFSLFPDNRLMTNSLLIKYNGANDPDITILPIPESIPLSEAPGYPIDSICNHINPDEIDSAVYIIVMTYLTGEYQELERGITESIQVAIEDINNNV